MWVVVAEAVVKLQHLLDHLDLPLYNKRRNLFKHSYLWFNPSNLHAPRNRSYLLLNFYSVCWIRSMHD